jgi:hypothetical protein
MVDLGCTLCLGGGARSHGARASRHGAVNIAPDARLMFGKRSV